MKLPILYSFRRCPYAMRARLALMHCGVSCELREIVLRDKPAHMLAISSKGTVPVLSLQNETDNSASSPCDKTSPELKSLTQSMVIDESIDIMRWALNQSEPSLNQAARENWLKTETLTAEAIDALIHRNDFEFKEHLDHYKYFDRFPEHSQDYYLEQAMSFLNALEQLLSNSTYLSGSEFRFVDAAILPFVRQFSMVNPKQFAELPLPNLQQWLAKGLDSDLFKSIMQKYPQWLDDSDSVVFGKA